MNRGRLSRFLCAALFGMAAFLSASPFDSILNRNGALGKVDSSADAYEYIGDNVIARGHVVIRSGNILLTADKAVFNLELQDVELSGHVAFSIRGTMLCNFTEKDYEKAVRDPYRIVKKIQTLTAVTGETLIQAQVTKNTMFMNAERAFMNILSGTIQFKDFMLKQGILYAEGAKAERHFDGTITVRNARFSTCNYMFDKHDHYALSAKKAVIKPAGSKRGLLNYNLDSGDATVITQNSFLELWGVPVLWFPFLYKPPEEGGFGGRIAFGKNSTWGYYIRTAKNIRVFDEPYLNANILLDGYTERGFGYGVNLDMLTGESSTDLFFYGISDRKPYNYWGEGSKKDNDWQKNNSRLKIPNYRYEFRLSNLTHITPRMDFRGQVDLISDYNFLNDYFGRRYKENIEPPTYVAVEKQFDRFTASLYTAFRVNSFYSTVERLPELKLSFQRQELLHGLYYQGETSLGYYQMKWREWDRDRIYGNLVNPKNYSSFRFDSLHMFYYPLQFFNINIIPRAGFRLTAYSRSSKRKITSADLSNILAADSVDGQPTVDVINYDKKGGSRFRFAGELGVEVNTKFYRSWQNVKSEFLGLDGLRHVIIPYVNYTFIPKPTVSADHLYYFDEIDRIDENHFIRLGLVNRLQTRRGGQIREWFSMENYWDYFFYKAEGFNHIGDFGTILTFHPTDKLTLRSSVLLDLGQTNKHNVEVYRGRRRAGRPGLSSKLFNQFNISMTWNFAPRWSISAGYGYSDDYVQRNPYSMGSTLAAVTASSLLFRHYTRGQEFSALFNFPVIDEKTDGYISMTYDVDAGYMTKAALGVTRTFHCWRVGGEFGRNCKRKGADYKKTYSNYFAFFVTLTAMPEISFGRKLEP